jgi:DNA repair protein RadC
VYLLDAKHRPIAFETVSVGVLDGSLIHPREVFKSAVAERGAVFSHNHPSGDPPERSGQEVTALRRRVNCSECPWSITSSLVRAGPTTPSGKEATGHEEPH